MGARQPGQGPRPRHDPVRVVATTARREPAAPGVAMRERSTSRAAAPCAVVVTSQVRERIPGVRIGAVLRHDEVRRERGGQLGEQQRNRRQPRPLAGPGRQRHVDAGPGRHALAHLVDVARPREQRPAGLVEGDRQHARIVPVDRLNPVAVMDIEVDVQDAQPVAPRPGDRQRRVVVDAEPRCPLGHRVMQPAAGVQRVLHVPAQDRLDRAERPAGDRRGRLVHAGERRAVATLADARLREARTGRPRSA